MWQGRLCICKKTRLWQLLSDSQFQIILMADMLPVLLHRFLQRNGLHEIRHGPGDNRGILHQDSGGFLHEQAGPGLTFPCGSGDSLLYSGSDHNVLHMLCNLAEKKRREDLIQRDLRYQTRWYVLSP